MKFREKDYPPPQLRLFAQEIINHLTNHVQVESYKMITDQIGEKPYVITRIFDKEEPINIATLVKYIEKLITEYQLTYDPVTLAVSDGKIPEKSNKTEQSNPDQFIGGPDGDHWRVMVEIWDRQNTVRQVGIRYLKIHNLENEVEFFVGLDDHHREYSGKGKFILSGKQLKFNLTIKKDNDKAKMVYLRFVTGSSSASPSLMTGIMVQNYQDYNRNSAYIVFAENVTKEEGPFIAKKMPFEEFAVWKPEIARYFKLHNTFIHCQSGITCLDKLKEHNDVREIQEKRAGRGRGFFNLFTSLLRRSG